MPKIKNRVLTEINYSYLRPINDSFVRNTYKKRGFNSRSEFMDSIVSFVRTHKTPIQGTQMVGTKTMVTKAAVAKTTGKRRVAQARAPKVARAARTRTASRTATRTIQAA